MKEENKLVEVKFMLEYCLFVEYIKKFKLNKKDFDKRMKKLILDDFKNNVSV